VWADRSRFGRQQEKQIERLIGSTGARI